MVSSRNVRQDYTQNILQRDFLVISFFSLDICVLLHLTFMLSLVFQLWTSDNQTEGDDAEEARD